MVLAADARSKFDLETMKRYFGEPVLAGDETIQTFNEFAMKMAESLDPGDAAAHVITYHFILETHWHMRLLRFRAYSAAYNGMSMENVTEAARKTRTSESEAAAFLNLQRTFAINQRFDLLITQSSKRLNSLLSQIAMHRISLAESLRRRLEMEERQVEIDYKKMMVQKEEEMQAVLQEKTQKRLEQEQQDKKNRREQLIKQMQKKGEDKSAGEQPANKIEN